MSDAGQWLQDFVAEIRATDPLMMEPSFPIRDNETVIIQIEDECLRRVMSLGLYLQRENQRNLLEAGYAVGDEKSGLLHQASLGYYKSAACFQLFWAYVVDTMPELTGGKLLGIRKDWQIVEIKAERKPGMLEFFFGPPPQE